MATQYEGFDIPLKAYDDMSTSQYLFVKMNGNGIADVCAAATDIVLGVLQDEGTTGQGVTVRTMGYSKISLSAVVAAGALVGTTTEGKAVTITAGSSTTAYIAGQCVVGGNTGEIGEISLYPAGRAA
ncbi:MAG: hypothetical protein WC455_24825 [Dehalococcoidia bacterium]|jgi:hypothetical protein